MPRSVSLRSLKQLLLARWEILLIEICSLADYATATFVGGPRDNKDTNALDGALLLMTGVLGAERRRVSVGSIIAIFGAETISRPIAHLTQMTQRIAAGDFNERIDIPGRNEIGVLAASFNEMTRRLNESIEHLNETTAAKECIESEFKIAHEIQMSMVPKIFSSVFRTAASLIFLLL